MNEVERLSHTASLLNAGLLSQASEELKLVSDKQDPRRILLSAAIDQAEGRACDALQKLCRVASSEELRCQAVHRIITIAANNPESPYALPALNAVPELDRSDLYWMVLGNVLLKLNRLEETLRAWSKVVNPN